MRTIRLYGRLGKAFGKTFRLDVKSAAEAIRALCVQLPGFEQHLHKHSAPGYRVHVGKHKGVGTDELALQSAGDISIVPVVRGSGGKGGLGQIILGAVLIAAAVFVVPAGLTILGASVSGAMTSMGMSMLLGGISQMLAISTAADVRQSPDAKASYTLDGPVNTTSQLNPVAVVYGKAVTGSQVVSASILTEEMAV